MAEEERTAPRAGHGDERQTLSARRARGRRIAMALYYTMVTAVGGACAFEVSRQVLFPVTSANQAPCRDAARGLLTAVQRARDAAASVEGGEDVAIARFRQELAPEWSGYGAVAARCRGTTADAGTLDAIQRLRYAEEHAVRREAGDLAPLRRRVQAIVDTSGPDMRP